MELNKDFINELNKAISQKVSTDQKITELKSITKKYNPEWGDSHILKFLDIYLLLCVFLYGTIHDL